MPIIVVDMHTVHELAKDWIRGMTFGDLFTVLTGLNPKDVTNLSFKLALGRNDYVISWE